MTSNRPIGASAKPVLTSLDLSEIRRAVSAVRAASPRSILADLVDEKLRAIDEGEPLPRRGAAPTWRVFS